MARAPKPAAPAVTPGTGTVNLVLYLIVVVVWGSSWIAIVFQLGTVAPEVSIVWRFAVAAAVLLAWCAATGQRLAFPAVAHRRLAVQGALLFGLNYVLIYHASRFLPSGLVSICFSTLTVMNIANAAWFLDARASRRVIAGAVLGLAGLALVFRPQLAAIDGGAMTVLGIALALAGTYSASLGMIVSARNQLDGLPVLGTTGYSMAYGTVMVALYALAAGHAFTFEWTPAYVGSLAWLAVVSSTVGFGCYLTLLGRVGPGTAAYASVMFPVIALALSAFFEGWTPTPDALAGAALVLCGNVIVLTPLAAWRRVARPLGRRPRQAGKDGG